jgi:hypothetical protein
MDDIAPPNEAVEVHEAVVIDLARPVGSHKVRGFQPPWQTVFDYRCPNGHDVTVRANAFIGRRAVAGVGGVICPACDALKAKP